jgi:hypothetical protein
MRRLRNEDEANPKGKRRGSRSVEDEGQYDYLFVCNRWLAKDEDDGQTVRELVPMDDTGTKPRGSSLAGMVHTTPGIPEKLLDF